MPRNASHAASSIMAELALTQLKDVLDVYVDPSMRKG